MGENCFLNSITITSSFRSDNYWIIDLQAPLLFHLTLTSHRSLFSSCSTPRSNNCTNMVALFRIVLNAFKLVNVQWHEKAFCPFQISLVFTYLSHFQVIKQMLLLQKYNLSKYKMQFIMGKHWQEYQNYSRVETHLIREIKREEATEQKCDPSLTSVAKTYADQKKNIKAFIRFRGNCLLTIAQWSRSSTSWKVGDLITGCCSLYANISLLNPK